MAKKVVVPARFHALKKLPKHKRDHMLNAAAHRATVHCEIEENPSDAAWQKAFEGHLDEMMSESLTPHMNPATPRTLAAYRMSEFDKFFSDSEEGSLLYRQTRSALNSVVSVIGYHIMGIKRASDTFLASPDPVKASAAGRNQIKRLILTTALASLTKKLFSLDWKRLSALVDEKFKDMSYGELSAQPLREAVARAVHEKIEDALKGVNIESLSVQGVEASKTKALPAPEKEKGEAKP